MEPRYTNPVADIETLDLRTQSGHTSDDLMTGYHRRASHWKFAFHNMQIGAANTARINAEEHLVIVGLRHRHVGDSQRSCNYGSWIIEKPSFHFNYRITQARTFCAFLIREYSEYNRTAYFESTS
jgi:hypothetical protein